VSRAGGELRGRIAKVFDCGSFGNLTVCEISAFSGRSERSIYARIKAGAKGSELCLRHIERKRSAPKTRYTDAMHSTGSMAIHIAVKLVRDYPKKAPTAAQLQSIYGMSRATAYRWRGAMIDAGIQP
jgi:predicted DNA-binding transcriptional regulator AlpA